MTEFAPYTYPAPAFVPYSNARPLRTRALVATVALGFVIVSAVATAAVGFFATAITGDAVARGGGRNDAELMAAGVLALTGLVTIAALLFAGVAFICWLHRARTNVDAFGGAWMKWGPGWTIGSWFVPIGNLVIPILVMNEIDRATDGHVGGWRLRRPARGVVTLWAILWTAFLILDRVTTFATFDAAHSGGALAFTVLTAAVEVGAAVCAILVIRRITTGQDALLSAPVGGGAIPAGQTAFGQGFPAPAHGLAFPGSGPGQAFPGPAPGQAFFAPAQAPAPGPTYSAAPYAAAGDTWEAGLASGPIGWDPPDPDRRGPGLSRD